MSNTSVYFPRLIDSALDAWAVNRQHKSLLLRGARQVGKSSAVRALAKRHFTNYIEVNFESTPSVKEFFEGDIDVRRILH